MIRRERFGPWASVTGASAGIGREFARQLASTGLHLVLAARRLGELERLPLQPLSVEQCVSEALHALANGRASVVPSFLVRFLKTVVPTTLARRLQMNMFAAGIEARDRHALDSR